MSKRAPRLQFTDEELAAPEVSKAAKKAAKRIEKLERLEEKIPMKNGTEKPRPASKLQHAVRDAPGKAVRSAVHREVSQHEDDNVGVESVHKLEEAAEQTVRAVETAHRSHQLKPYRSADRAEARADSANLDALQKQAQQQNPELQLLFDKQYILTETVETEIRYRLETRYDEDGNPYTVQVPYEYTICTVTLENFDLSHVPVYVMSEDQLALYASYMATLGNRPDLFGDSDYVNRYYGNGSGGSYDIPPEALEDEAFAAIIKEAEKYLGFPYVWGGSSPATSFDCSGFVSYVYNNCGVGWSFGRLSAEGIRQICSYVSPADAKPGDLIFFEKTYNTTGASHIGIYVGNHTMLHCGDPIQYTSISSDYWQSHFLQFGRLAPP